MSEHMPPVRLGDRVRITGTTPDDPDPLPIGAEGTVDWLGQWTTELSEQTEARWDNERRLMLLPTHPDPFAEGGELIGVRWDNGRRLLLFPTDPFEVIGKRQDV